MKLNKNQDALKSSLVSELKELNKRNDIIRAQATGDQQQRQTVRPSLLLGKNLKSQNGPCETSLSASVKASSLCRTNPTKCINSDPILIDYNITNSAVLDAQQIKTNLSALSVENVAKQYFSSNLDDMPSSTLIEFNKNNVKYIYEMRPIKKITFPYKIQPKTAATADNNSVVTTTTYQPHEATHSYQSFLPAQNNYELLQNQLYQKQIKQHVNTHDDVLYTTSFVNPKEEYFLNQSFVTNLSHDQFSGSYGPKVPKEDLFLNHSFVTHVSHDSIGQQKATVFSSKQPITSNHSLVNARDVTAFNQSFCANHPKFRHSLEPPRRQLSQKPVQSHMGSLPMKKPKEVTFLNQSFQADASRKHFPMRPMQQKHAVLSRSRMPLNSSTFTPTLLQRSLYHKPVKQHMNAFEVTTLYNHIVPAYQEDVIFNHSLIAPRAENFCSQNFLPTLTPSFYPMSQNISKNKIRVNPHWHMVGPTTFQKNTPPEWKQKYPLYSKSYLKFPPMLCTRF